MTGLSLDEKEHTEATMSSIGWDIFKKYVQNKLLETTDLIVPTDIETLVAREQQLGKIEVLKELIPDFETFVKNQKPDK